MTPQSLNNTEKNMIPLISENWRMDQQSLTKADKTVTTTRGAKEKRNCDTQTLDNEKKLQATNSTNTTTTKIVPNNNPTFFPVYKNGASNIPVIIITLKYFHQLHRSIAHNQFVVQFIHKRSLALPLFRRFYSIFFFFFEFKITFVFCGYLFI